MNKPCTARELIKKVEQLNDCEHQHQKLKQALASAIKIHDTRQDPTGIAAQEFDDNIDYAWIIDLVREPHFSIELLKYVIDLLDTWLEHKNAHRRDLLDALEQEIALRQAVAKN